MTQKKRRKIKIQKPHQEGPEEERLWDDVRRFAKMVPQEPEPNLGRIREIKEAIAMGTYLNQEMLDDTASILSIKLMKGEVDSQLEA